MKLKILLIEILKLIAVQLITFAAELLCGYLRGEQEQFQ
jgi:hypothetical protein